MLNLVSGSSKKPPVETDFNGTYRVYELEGDGLKDLAFSVKVVHRPDYIGVEHLWDDGTPSRESPYPMSGAVAWDEQGKCFKFTRFEGDLLVADLTFPERNGPTQGAMTLRLTWETLEDGKIRENWYDFDANGQLIPTGRRIVRILVPKTAIH